MSFKFLDAFQQASAKERQLFFWTALVLGLVLLGSFNIAPALKTLREVPSQLSQLEAQTQTLKSLQAQAQALQKSPRLNPADAASLLQQSATEILGTGASLNIQGTRATLTLSGVSADSLAQFLAMARNKSHALPIEAHLQKFSGTTSGSASGSASGKATSAKELWRGALILNLPSR